MNPPDATSQDVLQLRDVHLPLSPELWPPAPGWWVLAAAVVALLTWAAFKLLRFWQRYRLQKEILATLDKLQQDHADDPTPQFLADVSILLRRVAIMKFPRQQVAALTGRGWLSFLDLHGGGGEYCNGVGSVLAEGPYARNVEAGDEVDKDALLLLTRKWIKQNLQFTNS